jgi:urea transport system ATP-binding protein
MGISVLLVEQYYDFAKELSDNYIVMRRGEVVAQGKGADMDLNGVQEMISV